MIRAAAFSLLMLAVGAEAEECGVSGRAALAPFKGTWVAEGANELIFGGKDLISYRKPDMAKPAPFRVVEAPSSEEVDDVSLDCETLDAAGIDRLAAKLQDYASYLKDSPDEYAEAEADIASLKKRLDHPPYPMVTASYYEWIAYYVRVGKDDLIAAEYGEARVSILKYKRKI